MRKEMERETWVESLPEGRPALPDNVITGMTPQKLWRMLEAADTGAVKHQASLAMDIEDRDYKYRSALLTRKLQVISLRSSIVPAENTPKAKDDAAFIREIFDDLPLIRIQRDMLDAISKGYSVQEMIWDTSTGIWWPKTVEYVDPRIFKLAEDNRSMVIDDGTRDGVPLGYGKFICHDPGLTSGMVFRGGLIRTVAVLHMCKSFSLKDWMTFAEVYGMPIRTAAYPPGAKRSEIEALKSQLKALGSNASAVYKQGTEIVLHQVRAGAGQGPYKELEQFLDRAITGLVLGQTMATEDPEHGSRAQADTAVEGVMKVWRDADAQNLAETVNAHLIRPIIDVNRGVRARYPRWVHDTRRRAMSITDLAQSLPVLVGMGLDVSKRDVYEIVGLSPPDEEDELLTVEDAGRIADAA